jgi:hypothetical protein
MADSKAASPKAASVTWWRFTGAYPANYQHHLTLDSTWVEPGEVMPWPEPPDSNWEQAEDPEAAPSKTAKKE